MSAMEAEHCSKKDSNVKFTTTNYKVTTTPQTEWNIVLKCDKTHADMKHKRKIPDIYELMHSDTAKRAALYIFEVISVVIYTGPMVRSLRSRIHSEAM
jgi:hypothetical protein